MTHDGPGNKDKSHAEAFAEVYNNVEKYPSLRLVAQALGKSCKTVRNYSAILRARARKDDSLPRLIWRASREARRDASSPETQQITLTAEDHAQRRAGALCDAVRGLFSGTMYPVINPDALQVRHTTMRRYDRLAGDYIEAEGPPRTWLSETLRVAPVSDPRGRRYIFTGAQNDAPVHETFWQNLLAYADEIGAQIVIGPWTYETNWWDETNPAARCYDPLISRFLCFGQMAIGENFLFCGEMNTLPTAARPISDMATYSAGRWAVFPHARLQLVSVPSIDPMQQSAQIMTTGAVTRPMVIPRKAGIKSLAQHVYGATLVEFDSEGDFFCRQLLAVEDGSFQDLDARVAHGLISYGHKVRAITAADAHVAKMNSGNALATFGVEPHKARRAPGSLVEELRPDWVILHDIHDHESRNHHNRNDVSHYYEMAVRGRESVADEVRRAVHFLELLKDAASRVLVVESNHDIALETYIREGRYRGDGINHVFGLKLDTAYHEHREYAARQADAQQPARSFSLLEWAVRHLAANDLDHVEWVHDGRSHLIDGVQVGFHGFRGTNGAKGTMTGFARLGHRITIGDKHTPGILDGVYCGGVMQLNHGYNKGPSGWATAHVIQYDNGTRTLVTLQNGKWRAKR